MSPPRVSRRTGRPRDPRTDSVILEAALRRLSQDGYSRMSLQAVADEAGVSKATIHLRWKTKADLATAAIEHDRLVELPPLVGHTRADLIAQLRWYESTVQHFSAMGILGACMSEEQTMPDLMRLIRERGARPRLQNILTVLHAAQGRKEIDPDADVEAAARLLYGEYYAEYFPGDAPNDLPERAVDLVLQSLGFKVVP